MYDWTHQRVSTAHLLQILVFDQQQIAKGMQNIKQLCDQWTL